MWQNSISHALCNMRDWGFRLFMWKDFKSVETETTLFTVCDCHRTKTSFYNKEVIFLIQLSRLQRLFMMHLMASIHFTWRLWGILLHTTSTTPLKISCKLTSPALSHQISPSGRERRKVKSLRWECDDLWTLWPVHTWVTVFVWLCVTARG